MAENLDDLLTVDHFLHKAIQFSKGLLLLHEGNADLFQSAADQPHIDADAGHSNDGKRYTDIQHTNQYDNDGKNRGNQLRHGLCDHLAQCIGIIGVQAHSFTVGMGVKVADRHPDQHLKGVLDVGNIGGQAGHNGCGGELVNVGERKGLHVCVHILPQIRSESGGGFGTEFGGENTCSELQQSADSKNKAIFPNSSHAALFHAEVNQI